MSELRSNKRSKGQLRRHSYVSSVRGSRAALINLVWRQEKALKTALRIVREAQKDLRRTLQSLAADDAQIRDQEATEARKKRMAL
jgi:hypothetical protein